MSKENVEIVRSLYSAMNARDVKATTEVIHPDAEWISDRRVGQAPIRGRDGVLEFFLDRAEVFDDLAVEIERLSGIADRVLAFVRVRGSGSASGVGVDIRIAHLWTLRDGLVIRGEGYGSRDEALEAAGLRT